MSKRRHRRLKSIPPPKEDKRILVVDDYEDNRQMYAELLVHEGFVVVEARDGAEAIAAARRLVPDLVVMDMSLPIIDGWEATRRLKADPRTSHIPVLALTGHAPEGIEGLSESAHKAGCDGFLAKPCSPEKLVEMVRGTILGARPAVRKARPRARPPRRASGG